MAVQVTVTEDQIEALADKLEGMADQFRPEDVAALHAVFALAGDALADRAEADVAGYAASATGLGAQALNFSLPTSPIGTQGVLIGLLRNGSPGGLHFNPGGAALGDGSV